MTDKPHNRNTNHCSTDGHRWTLTLSENDPNRYMAKLVDPKPDWLKTDQVDEIHSVGTDPIRIRKR